VRAFALALAMMLGGCSASELVQNSWNAAPVADLSQPDHRGIVASSLATIFPKNGDLGDLEISGVRQVDHLKGPAWQTCLKLDARRQPQNYAIFIQDGKVIEARAGILIDRCHKETYLPLELPLDSGKIGS
jgi:hypothetical protein